MSYDPQRTCANPACGKTFTPVRADQTCCSAQCRHRVYYLRDHNPNITGPVRRYHFHHWTDETPRQRMSAYNRQTYERQCAAAGRPKPRRVPRWEAAEASA